MARRLVLVGMAMLGVGPAWGQSKRSGIFYSTGSGAPFQNTSFLRRAGDVMHVPRCFLT